MNERTHFFIKIYLSHFILERVDVLLCVRGELETGTNCYILTQRSSDLSSTSSSFWLGCSTVGHWGPKLSVCRWLSLRHLVSNWNCNSNSLKLYVTPGYMIVWHPPASCGRTHLHRIQPCQQVKVIFRYLLPDASVSAVPLLIYTGVSLDWRLGRGWICYILWHINLCL